MVCEIHKMPNAVKQNSQEAKRDDGKLQLSLVPTQIIKDVAEVRMFGNRKYGDPDNFKSMLSDIRSDVSFIRGKLESAKDK